MNTEEILLWLEKRDFHLYYDEEFNYHRIDWNIPNYPKHKIQKYFLHSVNTNIHKLLIQAIEYEKEYLSK